MVDSNRFKGPFLKAQDLPDQGVCWTVSECVPKEMETRPGSGKYADQLVLHFEEDDRIVALKTTQIGQLQAIFGTPETDEWVGYRVVVFNDENVTFAGKPTGGIRFRAPRGKAANNLPAREIPSESDQYHGRPDNRSSPGGTGRHAGPPPRDQIAPDEDIPF